MNAAKLLQSADGLNATLWESGFTGDGVIIGTADSGIDSDHACFREMINSSGSESRKIVFTNILSMMEISLGTLTIDTGLMLLEV